LDKKGGRLGRSVGVPVCEEKKRGVKLPAKSRSIKDLPIDDLTVKEKG